MEPKTLLTGSSVLKKYFPPYIAEYAILNHRRLSKFTKEDANDMKKY